MTTCVLSGCEAVRARHCRNGHTATEDRSEGWARAEEKFDLFASISMTTCLLFGEKIARALYVKSDTHNARLWLRDRSLLILV